ncbi:MAG: TetR/AcrR family transcriptional regulator C-terminal domain-containing protein [Clostridia bacterium]|nr:TetR/AcrR family transcriptional regulator C-terminal domain-containing protein [Clostridia bacterium]
MAEVGVTKQVLAYSMKNLMTRQPLSKITVGDVCQSCGMNRKSFYYHFQDKYDLVAWIFRGDLAAEAEGADSLAGMMSALCRTMENNIPFYRCALKEGGQNSLQESITQELRPLLARAIAPHVTDPRLAATMTGMYADVCCGMLVRWVQSGCSIPTAEFLRLMQESAAVAGRMAATESLPPKITP